MLTKSIPKKLRDELAADPFYRTCCLADADCSGRIEWHHNLIYAGQRINAKFCILPACAWHHARARLKAIKDRLDRVMLYRATDEDLAKFPRINWAQLKRYVGIHVISKPMFKGVWYAAANFAPLPLLDTRLDQCPQPHR